MPLPSAYGTSTTAAKSLTVVTAIYGKGYILHEPAGSWPGCRFVCFTDQKLSSQHWEIRELPLGLDSRRSNRHVKTLVHRYVEGPTLYLDAAFAVLSNPIPIIGPHLGKKCWAATQHPERECLYDEAEFCVERGCSDSSALLRAQVKRYKKAGMPRKYGLWAGGLLARLGDDRSALLGETWWNEIECGSERDQVSLPFVVRKFRLPVSVIPGTFWTVPGIEYRREG